MGISKYIRNPWLIPNALQSRGLGYLIPDSLFLQCAYYSAFGKKLNLKKPLSFNEKLQWLKLYDRKPLYTVMVDKYAVKKYVSDIIGEKYIIPTLGVWNRFEDIEFSTLPDQFVLKCTHDSGGLVICKDKSMLNIEESKLKINGSLKRDYYLNGREWPYKNVARRIIAEKYICEVDGSVPKDYKIFCFNGQPEMTLVCSDRYSTHGMCEDFFDNNWIHIPMKRANHKNAKVQIKRPDCHKQMLYLAKKISCGIPFLRVDFYEVNGNVYFGEATFYPASGLEGFEPEDWDTKLGKKIRLSV